MAFAGTYDSLHQSGTIQQHLTVDLGTYEGFVTRRKVYETLVIFVIFSQSVRDFSPSDILSSGIFPYNLQLAKVISLCKKGCPVTVSNHRPISLLSVCSKIS